MRPQEPDLLVASEIDRTQEFAAGRLSLNFKKEDEMDPSPDLSAFRVFVAWP
jgi:hypothetical protein